eukprot:2449853-Rhodomonas_salina.3
MQLSTHRLALARFARCALALSPLKVSFVTAPGAVPSRPMAVGPHFYCVRASAAWLRITQQLTPASPLHLSAQRVSKKLRLPGGDERR